MPREKMVMEWEPYYHRIFSTFLYYFCIPITLWEYSSEHTMAVLTVHRSIQFRMAKDHETLPFVQQITKLKLT
jgi:hypothetical protein